MKNVLFLSVCSLSLFISHSLVAQAQSQKEWTENDSIRLSKMLNGEVPLHIDDAFKRELERSLLGHPAETDRQHWNEYLLDIKPDNNLLKSPSLLNSNPVYFKPLSDKLFNTSHEYLRIKGVMINSRAETHQPRINIQRNTNISIPLYNNKLYFNIYGSYARDKRRSVILPAISIPYTTGAGLSYHIGKNIVIESQTNYQYNIIYKKWEWFWGGRVIVRF